MDNPATTSDAADPTTMPYDPSATCLHQKRLCRRRGGPVYRRCCRVRQRRGVGRVVVAVTPVAAETAVIYVLKHVAPTNPFGVVCLLGVLVIST